MMDFHLSLKHRLLTANMFPIEQVHQIEQQLQSVKNNLEMVNAKTSENNLLLHHYKQFHTNPRRFL